MIILAFLSAIFSDDSSTENSPATKTSQGTEQKRVLEDASLWRNKARSYSLVDKDDISYAGRERYKISIVSPDSQSLEERAATVKNAAIELQKKTGADFVSVLLLPTENSKGKGYVLAMADYSPDGCGTGEKCDNKKLVVSASDVVLAKSQLQSISLWNEYKKKFAGSDGVLDIKEEKRLKQFISKQLNIPVKDVFVPSFFVLKNVEG
ncbi:hypothetical protein CIK43_18930 [Citrobacter sp. TSA-1]|nr:hypothetical protein CIK43_18930 [Citrobacter sp. TSA-1]